LSTPEGAADATLQYQYKINLEKAQPMVDINEFRENGFTVRKGLLSKERIASMFADISAIFDQALSGQGENPADYPSVDEKYLVLKEKYPALKAHCYDLIHSLDAIVTALSHDEVVAFGRQVYDTPLLAGPMQMRIDDPSDDRLLPWHQELEQFSLRTLNCWLPLRDVNAEVGTLAVVPGSHKEGLVDHHLVEIPHTYWSLPSEVIDDDKVIMVDLEAGDALLFDPFLFHGSMENPSNQIRWTMVVRWSEITHVPYLKDANADKVMARNPDAASPGAGFVESYKSKTA
jgi:phytanoyl-CoA hydroxylase